MVPDIDLAWRRGIRPEPPIPVSDWADRHRILPPTSAEPGRWRTDRTPYLRAVMDALSTSSPYERVVLMKGAQTGGSEAGLNWLGYIIQNAPGIAMLVMPSLDMVRRNTTVRIDPLIEATPALRDLVTDYRVLWGDPSGPRLWSDLDGVLNGTWGDLPVRAVAVDTGGHHTKMAYEFCRTRLARRIWAIKGRGGPGIPVWPRRPTRTNKGKIPLFIVGVDAVKDAVYARLKLTEPGPGAIHFPRRLDADYFRQLTAERVVTRFERGRPIRSWQPKRDGERNEALDTLVYAHAALHGLISMGMRLNDEVEMVAAKVGGGSGIGRHGRGVPAIIKSRWLA